MHRKLALLSALFSLVMACGADHTATDAGHGATDAGHTATDVPDAGFAVDAPSQDRDAPTDAPSGVDNGSTATPLLHGCGVADYEDRSGGADGDRVVRPRGTTGYTPDCISVRAGQSVTFEMNFATHPLTSGIAHGPTAGATTPSPIVAQRSGTTYSVTFADPGYYPFNCGIHAHVGMVGVVRVVP